MSARALANEIEFEEGVRNVDVVDPGALAGRDERVAPTVQSTATSTPASTPSPEPEPTPIPEPTEVPEPTPEPTEVPEPTPEPTEVPEPAPEPTEVPEPTPEPTEVVEPTPTPAAESAAEVVAELDLSGVMFVEDSATLTRDATAILDVIASRLVELDPVPIEVQGHTDDDGDPDVLLLLSQQRAEAVRDLLVSRGVDESLLTARGYGPARPIADNSTAEGRDANNRVAFVVVEGNN